MRKVAAKLIKPTPSSSEIAGLYLNFVIVRACVCMHAHSKKYLMGTL
jgi:hypothetical protein